MPNINPVTNSIDPLTVRITFHPKEPGGTKVVALAELFAVVLEEVVLVEFCVSLIEFGCSNLPYELPY